MLGVEGSLRRVAGRRPFGLGERLPQRRYVSSVLCCKRLSMGNARRGTSVVSAQLQKQKDPSSRTRRKKGKKQKMSPQGFVIAGDPRPLRGKIFLRKEK